MASAQLYWGRMAALILRILYGMFPMVDWSFVFVDDFCWILRGENAEIQAAALMVAMLAMGVPLSWKKTVLGDVNTWLGFVVDPKGPTIRMAEQKHDVVMVILQDLAEGKFFTAKEIERAMGRLQWATSACPPMPAGKALPSALLAMEGGGPHPRETKQAGALLCLVPLQALREALCSGLSLHSTYQLAWGQRCRSRKEWALLCWRLVVQPGHSSQGRCLVVPPRSQA